MTDEYEDCQEITEEETRSGQSQIIKSILVIQIPVLIIAVLWGMIRKIDWWHSVRCDSMVLWGLFLGLVLAAVNQFSYRLFRKLPFTNIDWMFDSLFYPLCREITLAQLIFISLLSGICEESLFRGVMQPEWGIIACNIVFGMLHTGDRRLIFMGFWSALMGVVLSYSYVLTGNLLVPMSAHAINNLCGFLFFRFFYTPENREIRHQ